MDPVIDPAVFNAGWPAVSVTKQGDVVMSYSRCNAMTFPEARFSILYANETSVRPSVLLRKGSYPLGVKGAGGLTGRIDNTGIALDPDALSVWVIQPFAEKQLDWQGRWTLVVAKVTP